MNTRGLDLIQQVACNQHATITRTELVDLGMSSSSIDRLAAGPWLERAGPGIYQLRGSPETWHRRLMCAVIMSGDALASHRSAAALWCLDGFVDQRHVEVVSPRWRRRTSGAFEVHETKDLKPHDRDVRDGIPVTSVARTLIDLGATSPIGRVGQALDDACRRDLVTLPEVRARFVELARRGRNGIGTMRMLLAERPGGDIPPDSTFERRMIRLISQAELPDPRRQHRVDLGLGTAYLDLAWPDVMVAVECDSTAHHMSLDQFHHDRERQNELVVRGWTVLRFTWRDLTRRPEWVIARLRSVLA